MNQVGDPKEEVNRLYEKGRTNLYLLSNITLFLNRYWRRMVRDCSQWRAFMKVEIIPRDVYSGDNEEDTWKRYQLNNNINK